MNTTEASPKLCDWDVDDPVTIITNVRNLLNDLSLLGLWTFRAVLTHVAIKTPRIPCTDKSSAVTKLDRT